MNRREGHVLLGQGMYLTQIVVGPAELSAGEWAKLVMNMNYGVAREGTVLKSQLLQRLYGMSRQREISIRYGTVYAGWSPKKLEEQLTKSLRHFEATAMQIVGSIHFREHQCTTCKKLRGPFSHCVTVAGVAGCANCYYHDRDAGCDLSENAVPRVRRSAAERHARRISDQSTEPHAALRGEITEQVTEVVRVETINTLRDRVTALVDAQDAAYDACDENILGRQASAPELGPNNTVVLSCHRTCRQLGRNIRACFTASQNREQERATEMTRPR
ncbi:hypothetical protein N7451_000634 [Penicillium sp. IBT 35674x]|nr:hypothetical protein N7451_000634 [Penicillium sp. IBT 35674x]